jgi:predicted phage terminase large subunit-like protein
MSTDKTLNKKIINRMLKDKQVRIAITKESHYVFFHLYCPHYVTYPTAEFQREIFEMTEDKKNKNLFIVASRGSAKSTIITMSFPIWAILGKQQKKFVLILCQTRHQAKQHMINLKQELESNELLKNDLGPFREEGDSEWGTTSLVFSRLNARISVASSEQSIRGLRHNQYRPDLIIGDDVEDMNSTRTREGRDKTYQWLTSEVIPCGDRNTRLVIVGNLLHEDSLLMRLKQDLKEGKIDGHFLSYPLVDENGIILWPGKYPTPEDIALERKKVGSESAWQREYMLRIVPNEGQLIDPRWIHYYDELPTKEQARFRYTATGVDLAISKNETADYTAMVSGNIYNWDGDVTIYILPDPINKRWSFPETVDQIKILANAGKNYPYFYIEEIGYQSALIGQLQHEGIRNVSGAKVHGQDKRSRLALTTHLIKSGKVLFPRKGAKFLIQQLTGFGIEKHDDLADAFAILVLKTMQGDHWLPKVTCIS